MPLCITIPGAEYYNEKTNEFVYTKDVNLKMEHSLLSITKWEMFYKKPFLTNNEKTAYEMLYYYWCMCITPNVDIRVFDGLTPDIVQTINNYIQATLSATTFNNKEKQTKKSHKVITNELVYSWMAQLGIPFECEKWHISRLMTLINVCSLEQQPPKQMNPKEAMSQQRALNQARRAARGSRG